MEYNFEEVGTRIRELRKRRNWSQEDLVAKLYISRNTLSAIENGKKEKFTLDILLSCCSLFDCDMGYLLGEYEECQTLDRQFIHNQTGLSEKAIENLHNLLRYHEGTERIALLNWLLDDPRFTHSLFDHIIKYCNRTLSFTQGRIAYRQEEFLAAKLSKNDISQLIRMKNTGEIHSTITNEKIAELADLKDVSYLKAQRAFDNVLDCLVYHHCKQNGCNLDDND